MLTGTGKQLTIRMDENYSPVFAVEDKEITELGWDNRRSYYYGNNHVVGYLDSAKLDWGVFASTLKNEMRQSVITDTDKVFFTKAALFPRASFNRYSDKARLVQTTKAATKYAFNNNFFEEIRTRDDEVILGTHTDAIGNKKDFYIGVDMDQYTQTLRDHSSSIREELAYITAFNKLNNFQRHNNRLKEALTALSARLKTLVPGGNWTCSRVAVKVLAAGTVKHLASMKTLTSGEVEFADMVIDLTVNSYIDNFKDSLDESTYEYLLQTLGAHTSDPEVPMQLLTNMKMEEGNPRLDALFISLSREAIANITNNRVMKTVDVRNFWETHNINELANPYNHGNFHQKLRLIGSRAAAYTTNSSRELLFNLLKDDLEEGINKELGFGNNSLTKIKLNYESL